MVISNKQISLVNKLYECYLEFTCESKSLEQFLSMFTSVDCLAKLTHKDVCNLVQKSDTYCTISDKQINFIQNIIHILSETLQKKPNELELEVLKSCRIQNTSLHSLTKSQLTSILSYVQSVYNIFIPNKINWSNYKYKLSEKTNEYIIGEQVNVYKKRVMKIISFKRLLVLDWDDTELQTILQVLRTVPYKFRVYQTHNGYHAYCTSHFFPHDDLRTLQIMKRLNCDEAYMTFTYYTGFVIRLTPKPGRIEPFIEKYIQSVNKQYQDIPVLNEIINIKDDLINELN